ncbi:hypothetical protein JCM10213_007847 [Rhodosporidiobolus nylandii]
MYVHPLPSPSRVPPPSLGALTSRPPCTRSPGVPLSSLAQPLSSHSATTNEPPAHAPLRSRKPLPTSSAASPALPPQPFSAAQAGRGTAEWVPEELERPAEGCPPAAGDEGGAALVTPAQSGGGRDAQATATGGGGVGGETHGGAGAANEQGDAKHEQAGSAPAPAPTSPITSSLTTNTRHNPPPQRQPSLRAAAAFSRLRIGSSGTTPRPSAPRAPSVNSGGSAPSSPTMDDKSNSKEEGRTLSPDSYTASPSPSRYRAMEGSTGSLVSVSSSVSAVSTVSVSSSTTPTAAATAPGASTGNTNTNNPPPQRRKSLAASFLSSFSPSSRRSSIASNSAKGKHGQDWPAFASPLPPRGDEAGFVLKGVRDARGLNRGGEDETQEGDGEGEREDWILGAELGRGGMGLVREARLLRPNADGGREGAEEEKEQQQPRLAVKIIPRRRSAAACLPPHHHLAAAGVRQPPTPGARGREPSAPPLSSPSVAATASSSTASSSSPASTSSSSAAESSPRNPPAPTSTERLRVQLDSHRARSCSSPMRPSLSSRSRTTPAGSRQATPLPSPGLGLAGVDGAAQELAGKEEEKRGADEEGWDLDLDLEAKGEDDLLDLLLQRELALWRQLSSPSPPASASAEAHEKAGGKHLLPLLHSHRTPDFDYLFMPLASTTLLSYLTSPRPQLSSSSVSRTRSSRSRSRATSRSRSRTTAAGKHTSSSSSPAHSHSHSPAFRAHPRPRASLSSSITAIAGPSALPPPPPSGLPLAEAGSVFAQLVEALAELHERRGVAHRDLKLENVLGFWEEGSSSSEEEGDEEEEEREMEGSRDGRGRSRTRRGELEATAGEGSSPRRKRRRRRRRERVWKLADFGLAEVIPPSSTPTASGAATPSASASGMAGAKPRAGGGQEQRVKNVLPLSALARAGSLRRPGDGSHAHDSPHDQRTGHQQQRQSQSVFLPCPSASPAAPPPAPQNGHFHFAPPASLSQHPQSADAPSPLSALLHPVGSLPYSSPEALKSPVPLVAASGDIWALGCCLYALVEGKLPIWEEYEMKMRVRLVKGEWDVPAALSPGGGGGGGSDNEEEKEKAMALEVLKGCLTVDVAERWTVGRIAQSAWMEKIRRREVEAKERRRRERRERSEQRRRQREMGEGVVVEEREGEVGSRPASRVPSPARASPPLQQPEERGRSRVRRAVPPAPSAGAGSAAGTPEGEHPPPPQSFAAGSKSRSRSRISSSSSSSTHSHRLHSRSRSRSSFSLSSSSGATHTRAPSKSPSFRSLQLNFALSPSRESSALPSPYDAEEEREERRRMWEEEERRARSRSRARRGRRKGSGGNLGSLGGQGRE